MFFHRVLGNAHVLGHLALRKLMHLPQDEDFAALRRQRGDQRSDLLEFPPSGCNCFRTRSVAGDLETLGFGERAERNHLRAAKREQRDRFGHLEQVGSRIAYMIDAAQPGQDCVGFLNHVVDVEADQRPTCEPGAQFGLMRQNPSGEPQRTLLGGGSHAAPLGAACYTSGSFV